MGSTIYQNIGLLGKHSVVDLTRCVPHRVWGFLLRKEGGEIRDRKWYLTNLDSLPYDII